MIGDPIKDTIDKARSGAIGIQVCDNWPFTDTNGITIGWPWPIGSNTWLRKGFECKTLLHELSHAQDGFGLPNEDKADDYGINKYHDRCCDK